MDVGLIIARLIHIVSGVFWAGTLIFMARFLFPAIAEAGPDGGRVVQGMAKRGFMQAIPASAMLTILSGIYLFWRASAGFDPAYMGSGPGITYSIGALSAIIALIIGGTVVRGSMMNTMAKSQAATATEGTERERLLGEAQASRARAGSAGNLVAVLLGLTVICMAVGRYV